MSHYLAKSDYDALVDALANLEPCPMEGRVTRDQVMMALGMHGEIWPMAILPDVLRGADEVCSGMFCAGASSNGAF